MLYLLDTNVLSRLARGVDPLILGKVRENLLNCRVSAVSWFELQYGAAKSSHPEKALPRLTMLRMIFPVSEPFEDHAARRAADVRAALESLRPNAQPIGPFDVLLAGHALALGAVMVTRNVGEYARVPGLALEDWQTR
jgi:tRNA(fMet)-specific endonuclease VapC